MIMQAGFHSSTACLRCAEQLRGSGGHLGRVRRPQLPAVLFGVYNVPGAAAKTYLGLFALQHRGQESAGIVVSDGKKIDSRKGMGLVTEVFSKRDLDALEGHIAVGHVRYSTTGSSRPQNIQPLVVDYSNGLVAVAHNGNLVNARTLRDEYEAYGSIFQTSTDSEIIVHLMARPENVGRKDQLAHSLNLIKGAYSFLFMTRDKLIGARDPQGFRPLILGRMQAEGNLGSIGEGYVLCSETCALDQVGAEFVREIEPGEIVTIDAEGLHSSIFADKEEIKPAHCIFEHVYFARPDSMIFGDDVHKVRIRLGEKLAEEHPAKADVVFAVPDSGNAGAIGYARKSGIPLDMGFIRNHYVGRSFIKPNQDERENVVAMKFNVVRSAVRGKRVVVVEDSLIRGTTAASESQAKNFAQGRRDRGPSADHLSAHAQRLLLRHRLSQQRRTGGGAPQIDPCDRRIPRRRFARLPERRRPARRCHAAQIALLHRLLDRKVSLGPDRCDGQVRDGAGRATAEMLKPWHGPLAHECKYSIPTGHKDTDLLFAFFQILMGQRPNATR